MRVALSSLVLIASIPLLTLALEPANPTGFCARFVGEKNIQSCEARTEKEEIDWYAAAVCNLQESDEAFWSCWDQAKGKTFNPQALEKCGEDTPLSDAQRLSCIQAAGSSRKPASTEGELFQPLKTKKRSIR